MDGLTPSKIDLNHAESRVVFAICDCSLDKRYSFYCLNREQATILLKRLRHIEQMTWRQFVSLPRESSLTAEKPDTDSFKMIDDQNTCEKKFLEKFYFHFRVEQKGLFRIFGYQKDQFFCITHIDCQGKIHH